MYDIAARSLPPETRGGATQGPGEVRWRFGAFVLWETQRRLEKLGQGVRLGSRSFELLLQLLRRVGEVVGKEELLSTVWAGVVVEESSVRVHISALRKALGEPEDGDDCKEWISNVPLRGYRFNGAVSREQVGIPAEGRPLDTALPSPSFTKLPERLTRLVGRDADMERVLAALATRRLVTIVGAGGIGKTRAAIRAAECHAERTDMQLAFVDLSPLVSQAHVASTVARSLGAPADTTDTTRAILQRLAGRHALLLIDNCEHMLDSLALLITELLGALPGLRILATSREAIRIEGEHVERLSPLAVPGAECAALAEAMASPAVELLVERAKAAGARAFEDADGRLLAAIARQVDGIPLAIELVAARLGVQPIGDLAFRLNDHMRLYSAGSRAALPRHRTLAAALDWSIALLDDAELRLLRRLSVFRGRFDVESALSVTQADMDPEAAFDALISLANKSLVSFDNSDAVAPYRLLDTTRSYAAALLAQTDEGPALRRRHALFMRDLMSAATSDSGELTMQAWNARYAHRLDDVRSALDACLAQHQDWETGAALTIASAPLWFHVSQVEEYRDRVIAALACFEPPPGPGMDTETETEAWLQIALGNALWHTRGPVPEMGAAYDRALAVAMSTRSVMLELQARWGVCVLHASRGEYAAALHHSQVLFKIAHSSPDPAALNLAHRMTALASHFCGDFAAAGEGAQAAILVGDAVRQTRANLFQFDAAVASNALLARTLWLQGDAAKAMATATRAVALAEAGGNALSLCFALFGACPVALWSGEVELARKWVRMLLDEAQRRGLEYWHQWAHCFALGLEASTADDRDRHVRQVAQQLAAFDAPRKEMLVTFCTDWVDDATIAQADAGRGQWSAAETWRAAGRRCEQRGLDDEAEAFYRRAVDTARRQGALGWEFRGAIDLARLWVRLGRTKDALEVLDGICGRAVPGGDHPGLAQVRALRNELSRT
ncbi:transcriptional regulator [Variovorax paradoxus]|uniref:Transcriptional regulator n=1 Tax=Variovorax paradoxus TaxID=34073 RepID=A0A0D0MTT1_VARPD|nr:winged helix-turn-helix domain-containing protein [Variovorax paradoxus]KIQ34289.1 transcriptional regulator [Variovorax paradoxus]